MDNISVLHQKAVAGLHTVVARVTPADLARPTPCAGWDLRALLEHMTGQDRGFAAAVRAAANGSEVGASAFAPHPLGPSPAADVAAGLNEVVVTFAEASGLERPVLLAEFDARLPFRIIIGMHMVDTLVHGWDVAATLGTQAAYGAALDPDVVAAALVMAEQIPDDEAREAPDAPFGHVVAAPADASAWTRTLSLLGRDPARTTAASSPPAPAAPVAGPRRAGPA
jgi:uncharacterized protein (TIGR03086 family)